MISFILLLGEMKEFIISLMLMINGHLGYDACKIEELKTIEIGDYVQCGNIEYTEGEVIDINGGGYTIYGTHYLGINDLSVREKIGDVDVCYYEGKPELCIKDWIHNNVSKEYCRKYDKDENVEYIWLSCFTTGFDEPQITKIRKDDQTLVNVQGQDGWGENGIDFIRSPEGYLWTCDYVH